MSMFARTVTFLVALVTAALGIVAPATATSPGDNGRIAFRRFLDADRTTSAIFTVRPDGIGERQLTFPGPGTNDNQPDWAPNRRLIGFERCAPNTTCALYTIRPDGLHLTRLSRPCHAKPPAIETKCADESGLAFMPDGRHIIFTRATGHVDKEGFIEHSDLVIRDLSGRHTHVVVRGAPYSGDNVQSVASPTGTRLAFQRTTSALGTPADRTAVFVVDTNGRHRHRVTPWALDAGDHPDWSPNGRWILFRNNESGSFLNSQLFLVHPDGTGIRRLTHVSADTLLLSASFSPDGRRVVFAQSGLGGLPDVFTMTTRGADVQAVTHDPHWDSAPDWGPRCCSPN